MRFRTWLVALVVLAAPVASCGCNGHIDYTIPPVETALNGVDAVVRGTAVRAIEAAGSNQAWIELDVTEMLFVRPETGASPGLGSLAVREGVSNACSGPTPGLTTDSVDVIVLLSRRQGDDVDPDRMWSARWTLEASDDGTLRFLDGGYNLNKRIDEILPDATIEGLVALLEDRPRVVELN